MESNYKLLSFDLESFDEHNTKIACASLCIGEYNPFTRELKIDEGYPKVIHMNDFNAWDEKLARRFVDDLEYFYYNDYKIITFNGAGYDFRMLYSLVNKSYVRSLCFNHYDIMFHVMMMSGGYACKLSNLAKGMKASYSKIDTIEFSDGRIMRDFTGADFHYAWAYEPQKTFEYVLSDATLNLELWARIYHSNAIRYYTSNGRLKYYKIKNMPNLGDILDPRKLKRILDGEDKNYNFMKEQLLWLQ